MREHRRRHHGLDLQAVSNWTTRAKPSVLPALCSKADFHRAPISRSARRSVQACPIVSFEPSAQPKRFSATAVVSAPQGYAYIYTHIMHFPPQIKKKRGKITTVHKYRAKEKKTHTHIYFSFLFRCHLLLASPLPFLQGKKKTNQTTNQPTNKPNQTHKFNPNRSRIRISNRKKKSATFPPASANNTNTTTAATATPPPPCHPLRRRRSPVARPPLPQFPRPPAPQPQPRLLQLRLLPVRHRLLRRLRRFDHRLRR